MNSQSFSLSYFIIICFVRLSSLALADETKTNWNNDDVQSRLKYQYNGLVKSSLSNSNNKNIQPGHYHHLVGYRSPSAFIKAMDDAYENINDDDHHYPHHLHHEDASDIENKKDPEIELTDPDGGADEDNIRVPVRSKRRFEFKPMHYDRQDRKMPQMIEIVSDTMPLRLHFKSQSAAIVVSQSHESPPMKSMGETITMDEPFRLTHRAYKPIVQEVKEIIQPYRNIVQQVKPVIEDIRTIVPRDNDVNHRHVTRENRSVDREKFNEESRKNLLNNFNNNNNYNNAYYQKKPLNMIQYEPIKISETQQQRSIQRRAHLDLNGKFNTNHHHHHHDHVYPNPSATLLLESSEPDIAFAPETATIGDLYEDNISKKRRKIEVRDGHNFQLDYGTPPTPPTTSIMREMQLIGQQHHLINGNHHQHHRGFMDHLSTTTTYDNDNDGYVTVGDEEDHNVFEAMDYMHSGGSDVLSSPPALLDHHHYLHHNYHHPHHMSPHPFDPPYLHYHNHQSENDHNDDHFFATLVR